LDEGTEDAVSLTSGELVEEDVVAEANGGKILEPTLPRAYLLLVGSLGDCVVAGCSRSLQISHEAISFGRGCRCNPFGTCSGHEVRIREITALSVRWWSRDKISLTPFASPSTH